VRKLCKLAVAAIVALAVGPVLAAAPAGATPPTGYGFDDIQHVIVGGGSDTTFKVMNNIQAIYNVSSLSGCERVTAVGPTLGNCVPKATEISNLGNWQHDTTVEAGPVGSSAGIASLNGNPSNVQYPGTVNPAPAGYPCVLSTTNPEIDYGRSSRGPRTSGGNATCGNELTADTFWGYAQDGVEVVTFNNRGSYVQAQGGNAIAPIDLYKIWHCDYTNWSDVPGLNIAPGSPNDGPLEPWGMNSSSGTFATFRDFLRTASGDANFDPDAGVCVRHLSDTTFPFENDLKLIINDPASLSTVATSPDNPENWLFWGSFGVFSAFPYTSSVNRGGTPYQGIAVPVNGILPSTSFILSQTYPIGRTLYHVTRKPDADCVKTGTSCDFLGHPGPALPGGGTDLNVTGGTTGTSGAVRELTRFMCRNVATGPTLQQGKDPLTGVSFLNAIQGAIAASGFTLPPSAIRTPGSRCQVIS
jgi:ABC-type phosphate transport system substrate-binding protein